MMRTSKSQVGEPEKRLIFQRVRDGIVDVRSEGGPGLKVQVRVKGREGGLGQEC